MFELVEPIGVIPYSAGEPNDAMFAPGVHELTAAEQAGGQTVCLCLSSAGRQRPVLPRAERCHWYCDLGRVFLCEHGIENRLPGKPRRPLPPARGLDQRQLLWPRRPPQRHSVAGCLHKFMMPGIWHGDDAIFRPASLADAAMIYCSSRGAAGNGLHGRVLRRGRLAA